MGEWKREKGEGRRANGEQMLRGRRCVQGRFARGVGWSNRIGSFMLAYLDGSYRTALIGSLAWTQHPSISGVVWGQKVLKMSTSLLISSDATV